MSTPSASAATTQTTTPPTKYKEFLGQNYEKIKEDCLKNNKLFVDDKFPAENSSLFKFNEKYALNVTWRRPLEILKNKPVYQPVFVKEKIRTSDIRQAVNILYFLLNALK